MLTKEFVQEAISVANFFAEKGKGITPTPNTPLSRLTRTQDEKIRNAVLLGGTDVQGNPELQPGFEADLAVNLICNSADQSINEVVESNGFMGAHAEVMDQEVQKAKKHLLSVFHTVRNSVHPQIKRLYDDVQTALENNVHGKASRFEVVTNGMPKLYTNPAFRERIAPYAGVGQGQSIAYPQYFTPVSDVALVEFVKTGLSIDAEYAEAIGSERVLQELWQAFFVSNSQKENVKEDITMASISASANSDGYLIGLYLLVDAVLSNRIPEGAQYVAQGVEPTQAIHEAATNLRAVVGKALHIRASQAMEAVTSKRLVIRYDEYKAYVNDAVYDEFMEAGGSQEMILGNLMNRGKIYMFEEMLERGTELEQAWERGVSILVDADHKNRLIIQRRVAMEVFKQMLKEIADANPEAVVNVNQLTSTFLKVYDSLPEEELRNFHVAATRLICRSLYTDPCFEYILGQMFSIKREQPNTEMDHVVTLAFINYVGRWLANQITTNHRT